MIEQYVTPVPQESYHTFGLVSAVLGFFLLAYFFIYQGAYKSRKLIIEVVLALLASAALGSAIFFFGLSVGIYM